MRLYKDFSAVRVSLDSRMRKEIRNFLGCNFIEVWYEIFVKFCSFDKFSPQELNF